MRYHFEVKPTVSGTPTSDRPEIVKALAETGMVRPSPLRLEMLRTPNLRAKAPSAMKSAPFIIAWFIRCSMPADRPAFVPMPRPSII